MFRFLIALTALATLCVCPQAHAETKSIGTCSMPSDDPALAVVIECSKGSLSACQRVDVVPLSTPCRQLVRDQIVKLQANPTKSPEPFRSASERPNMQTPPYAVDLLPVALIFAVVIVYFIYWVSNHASRRLVNHQAVTAPPPIPDATSAKQATLSDAPNSISHRPFSKNMLALFFGVLMLGSLFIVAAVWFRLLDDTDHPIIETLLLAVIVIWASVPLAVSSRGLLAKAAHYATMLFPILYLSVYQTIIWFWLTLAALVGVVIFENAKRLDSEPLYTKFVQVMIVLFAVAGAIYKFTDYLLPPLRATLEAQFTSLFQILKLRESLAFIVICIVLYGTIVNIIRRGQLSGFFDFGTPPAPHHNPIIAIGRTLRHYGFNFLRNLSKAFVTFLVEAVLYIRTTFFSGHLWWTILYIASTVAIMVILVADVVVVQPYLANVLRSTDPFLAPGMVLIMSYAVLFVGCVAAGIVLFPLTLIWLPRPATHEAQHRAFRKITLGHRLIKSHPNSNCSKFD